RIEASAALGLGPEPGEPLPAPRDDVRQARERLHIVDDGRLSERSLDRGEGRLDLGPALFALEGGEEPRLLAANVRARPAMHDDVEVEPRPLEVLAEEPRRVGFLDRGAHDAPR